MGMTIRKIPEPRAGRVPPFNHPDHLLRGPVGLVTIFRKVPRSVKIVIIRHAVRELLTGITSIAKEQLVIIYRTLLNTAFLY